MTMPANIQDAIPYILFAIAFLILAWVMLRASRKTRIIDKVEGDVLDEGAAPAARNQALIDSAPAATAPQSVPAPETSPETPPDPAPEPAPQPVPVAAPAGDDLRKIKGLGPKLVTILAEQGVTRFEQIAAWSDADVERVDATLGRFAGRIARDQWVEQAKLLASGEETAFSDKFGQK